MTAPPRGPRPIPVTLILSFALGIAGFMAAAWTSWEGRSPRTNTLADGLTTNALWPAVATGVIAATAAWFARRRIRAAMGAAFVALFGYYSAMLLFGFAV